MAVKNASEPLMFQSHLWWLTRSSGYVGSVWQRHERRPNESVLSIQSMIHLMRHLSDSKFMLLESLLNRDKSLEEDNQANHVISKASGTDLVPVIGTVHWNIDNHKLKNRSLVCGCQNVTACKARVTTNETTVAMHLPIWHFESLEWHTPLVQVSVQLDRDRSN